VRGPPLLGTSRGRGGGEKIRGRGSPCDREVRGGTSKTGSPPQCRQTDRAVALTHPQPMLCCAVLCCAVQVSVPASLLVGPPTHKALDGKRGVGGWGSGCVDEPYTLHPKPSACFSRNGAFLLHCCAATQPQLAACYPLTGGITPPKKPPYQ
jgi:hypothetical protein